MHDGGEALAASSTVAPRTTHDGGGAMADSFTIRAPTCSGTGREQVVNRCARHIKTHQPRCLFSAGTRAAEGRTKVWTSSGTGHEQVLQAQMTHPPCRLLPAGSRRPGKGAIYVRDNGSGRTSMTRPNLFS